MESDNKWTLESPFTELSSLYHLIWINLFSHYLIQSFQTVADNEAFVAIFHFSWESLGKFNYELLISFSIPVINRLHLHQRILTAITQSIRLFPYFYYRSTVISFRKWVDMIVQHQHLVLFIHILCFLDFILSNFNFWIMGISQLHKGYENLWQLWG